MGNRREIDLGRLAERLGLPPSATPHLEQALTHRSAISDPQKRHQNNEVLEFLGDAVLDLVVADMALEQAPGAGEGALSRVRAALVNGRALAQQARQLGLGPLLRLGKGESRGGGSAKESILAGAFEAVVAVVYRLSGLPGVRRMLEAALADQLRELLTRPALEEMDPKSALQEALQATDGSAPSYRVLSSQGPDHARHFQVEVRHHDRVLAVGEGASRRQAERCAARRALQVMAGGTESA